MISTVLGAVITLVCFLVCIGAPLDLYHHCTRYQGQFRSLFDLVFLQPVVFPFSIFTFGRGEPCISVTSIPWIVILVQY